MPKHQEINLRSLRLIFLMALFMFGSRLWGQDDVTVTNPSSALLSTEDGGSQSSGPPSGAVANPPEANGTSSAKPKSTSSAGHRLGPFNISVNWRFRTESWDFFEPPIGQNAYAFEHPLLSHYLW